MTYSYLAKLINIPYKPAMIKIHFSALIPNSNQLNLNARLLSEEGGGKTQQQHATGQVIKSQ